MVIGDINGVLNVADQSRIESSRRVIRRISSKIGAWVCERRLGNRVGASSRTISTVKPCIKKSREKEHKLSEEERDESAVLEVPSKYQKQSREQRALTVALKLDGSYAN